MADWSGLTSGDERSMRGAYSRALMEAMSSDCLTRKPRDSMKRELMLQLGLPERYPEVQYPSPGNTPDDLDDEDF